MLRQSQQLRLLQRMSPQQIQFLKLLRVPTLEMETRIKEEMEINPALEYSTDDTQADIYEDVNEQPIQDSLDDVSLQDDHADQIDIDDYLRNEGDDGAYDYSAGDNEKGSYSSIRYEVDFHQGLLPFQPAFE